MGKKHFRSETVPSYPTQTLRFGTQGTPRNSTEVGKAIKLAGESGAVLCALGDPIDGRIESVETATADGFTIIGAQRRGDMFATAEGSQATGTGNLAIGDYVVCGTPVAEGVQQVGYMKVRKATAQVGAQAPTQADIQYLLGGAWKVASLCGGTGTPGSTVLLERAFLAN